MTEVKKHVEHYYGAFVDMYEGVAGHVCSDKRLVFVNRYSLGVPDVGFYCSACNTTWVVRNPVAEDYDRQFGPGMSFDGLVRYITGELLQGKVPWWERRT